MDYKKIIEEQIEYLCGLQRRLLQKEKEVDVASDACNIAKTIEYLCDAARKIPGK